MSEIRKKLLASSLAERRCATCCYGNFRHSYRLSYILQRRVNPITIEIEYDWILWMVVR